MRALTYTYKVAGRNRAELVSRLKKQGVDLLNVKIIDDKTAEITIDKKDRAKYFAICKNIWYNNLSKRGGLLAPLVYIYKNAAKSIGVLIIVLAMIFCENLYFGTEYRGDAIFYRGKIESAFETAGIKKFGFFRESDLKKVSSILSAEQNLSFLTLKKRGNKAIVSIKELKPSPQKFPVFYSDVIESEPCEIIKITVYSGTALKKAGDKAAAGDVIIGAYYEKESGERVSCPIIATYSAKYVFVYDYEAGLGFSEDCFSDAIAAAKTELFKTEEFPILGAYCTQNGASVRVIIEYEKTFPKA